MIVAKQIADLITLSRFFLIFVLVWIGFTRGAEGLPIAGVVLLWSWISDAIDGPTARRSSRSYQSWLGVHDLEIDMGVSVGLLVYLTASGFINPWFAVLYFVVWAIVFLRWGILRSLGMVSQAPIYVFMIWLCLQDATVIGILQLFFIIAAVLVTWPRFPNEIIPGFLAGLNDLRKKSA